jgi:hypothetical protein
VNVTSLGRLEMKSFQFDLFADYFQFYLQDEEADGDLSDAWTPDATDRMLAVADYVVGVGTVRNTTVPVTVELHGAAPADDFDSWDHVTQCSLTVSSGRVVVAGCTDYFADAPRIPVAPGCYSVRVSYGGLDTLSADGLEGADRYRVQLWPGQPCDPAIVKARAA